MKCEKCGSEIIVQLMKADDGIADVHKGYCESCGHVEENATKRIVQDRLDKKIKEK